MKKDFSKVYVTLNKEEAIQEAKRCMSCPSPFCMKGCPITNDIPFFIKALKEDNLIKAFELINEKSILPNICSLICPHEKQCEGSCIRNKNNEPVKIGRIEHFISSEYLKNRKIEIPKKNNIKVAVIGSGPSSLAFSLYLARRGYEITIFEKEEFLGGVLTWGIPSYRLAKDIVKEYFDELKILGAKFEFNKELGKNIFSKDIVKEYSGVYLGNGSIIPNKLNVIGEDLEGIYQADEFLKETNLNEGSEFRKYGKDILVVGGGNVAMDAARNAIRIPLSESVHIIYRRSLEEMPCSKRELNEAISEGVHISQLATPLRFSKSEDDKIIVEAAIMELGEVDSSGRRSPVESNKPHITFKVDSVILALGFTNNPSPIKDSGIKLDERNRIIVNSNNETSIENVFAGGDSVHGSKTVVIAMKDGLNAAKYFNLKTKSK